MENGGGGRGWAGQLCPGAPVDGGPRSGTLCSGLLYSAGHSRGIPPTSRRPKLRMEAHRLLGKHPGGPGLGRGVGGHLGEILRLRGR